MRLHVGCAMWTYAPWQGRYLPAALPPRERLAAYATWCNAVEGNTTFYATPAVDVVRTWAAQTAADFYQLAYSDRGNHAQFSRMLVESGAETKPAGISSSCRARERTDRPGFLFAPATTGTSRNGSAGAGPSSMLRSWPRRPCSSPAPPSRSPVRM